MKLSLDIDNHELEVKKFKQSKQLSSLIWAQGNKIISMCVNDEDRELIEVELDALARITGHERN